METPEEVALAEDNYLAAWRLLARSASGGTVVETDDLLFTCSALPVQYFNSAFVKPDVDPAGCIAIVKAFFADRHTPFTLRFRNDERFHPDDALESAGLVLAGSSPLMVAPTGDIEEVGDWSIRLVDEGSWHDHVETIANGFGIPLDLAESLIPATLAASGEYAGFIAHLDGIAVSTATLVVSDGVAGVYNVATPQAYRGRGFGGAATRAAVAEGLQRAAHIRRCKPPRWGTRCTRRWDTEL